MAKLRTLPLIPLPHNLVLFPGVTVRIPVQNRADVAAILAHIYSKASTPRPEPSSLTVGCVPLNSPYLSPDGKRLLEDAGAKDKKPTAIESDPSQARKPDLFQYGTMARVTGVQGRRGDLVMVVEGISRFKVDSFTKQRPYFEARVQLHEDAAVVDNDDKVKELFAQLKQLSRELIALIRLSALLPRGPSVSISPLLARRLELYIVRKDIADAGVLADFMTNVVECTHEDKLRILCALSVQERLERVVEALQKQISSLQGNGTILTITTNVPQNGTIDIETLRQRAAARGQAPGNNLGPLGGFGGPPGQDEEANEVEELKKKLQDAKLSPEAQKVADRELKRLARMNPAQAEHQVCRNYLENLAEIPWTKVTEDNLDAATLQRARQQLDDDHYGLEKIKKRLLEYLAVLKLKQAKNQELDQQIKAISTQAQNEEKQQKEAGSESASSGKDVATTTKPQAEPPRDKSPEEIKMLEHKKMVDKSPILLLVGPPGTGKTSLAKSVAASLGRQFHRISLGGVRDEAEIRGHRRTYVAAMPGLIVNGLKKVGVANPVFLLDEIDKVGTSSIHGDPSAAMLEVLDPEQNHTFVDHYVNIPIDLSKVLFIATANTLETIPAPLLDRMETIQLSGYTTLEKRHIATQHLLPKQIKTNGLRSEDLDLKEDALDKVITGYTRESGVRNLEREIGSVCRAKAVQYAEAKDNGSLFSYSPQVTADDLEDILGIERFEEELAARSAQRGVVTGLVAYSTGTQGSILFIEIADMPGSGRVQLTGKLGDVLKESVEVALSWVKSHAYELALVHDPNEDIMKNRSIHVHCPSGAIPKDGPSAGLAHTVALISLFSGKVVPPTIAMTGEVALRGKVMPVGGIKEKLIGALRAGVKKVLLPQQNRKDVKDLPDEVKEGLEIVHVSHIWEALPHIWPESSWGQQLTGFESRL